MAVNKVEIYVSQVLEDLNSGLTWLKKDDLGYGSIQEKYDAKDQQISIIRKHPALKNAETTVTVFTVIDDTKEDQSLESLPLVEEQYQESNPFDAVSNGSKVGAAEEELSAFANL
jgi:hypothetical protein